MNKFKKDLGIGSQSKSAESSISNQTNSLFLIGNCGGGSLKNSG